MMAECDYCKCGRKLITNLEMSMLICNSCMENKTAEVVNESPRVATMNLTESEIRALIKSAARAEAWFTHTEVTNDDRLDFEAYQTAGELRGALKVVEERAPELLK
jgi:hypothetical protein